MLCTILALVQCAVSLANFTNLTVGWQGQLAWQQLLDNKVATLPVLTNSSVVMGSKSRKLYSLSKLTGETVWTSTLEDDLLEEVLFSYQTELIYLGCTDGSIYGIFANNGTTAWKSEVQFAKSSKLVLHTDEMFLFVSGDSGLQCFDSRSGKSIWIKDVNQGIASYPIVDNNRLIVAFNGGILQCFKTSNGNDKWTLKLNDEITAGPVSDGHGKVLVGLSNGAIYAIDNKKGSVSWYSNASFFPIEDVLVREENVYAVANGSIVFIVNGTYRGNYSVGSIDSSIAHDGALLAFGANKGSLLALDSENKEAAWSYSVFGKIKFHPLLENNTSFFASNLGTVYSVKYSKTFHNATAGNTTIPFSDSTETNKSLGPGSISGIAIGALVVIALVIGLCCWLRTRHCKKDSN